ARGAFNRDLGIPLHRKSLRNRDKQSLQLRYIEYGRCAAAEEDGIHCGFVHAAQLSGEFVGVMDVLNHTFHVALEHGAGEDVRGEVAVAAFGAAEWHRDVEAQGHVTNYPTSRNVVSAERITVILSGVVAFTCESGHEVEGSL